MVSCKNDTLTRESLGIPLRPSSYLGNIERGWAVTEKINNPNDVTHISGRMACRMAEYSWLARDVSENISRRAYPNSGQIAGLSSTEFGLARMIMAGVNIGKVSQASSPE